MHLNHRVLFGCTLGLLATASAAVAQSKLPEGLRHVPLDALGFVHFRAGDFLKSPAGAALLKELQADREASKGLKKIEQALGIQASDLDSVTFLLLSSPFDSWDGDRLRELRDRDMKMRMEMLERRRMEEFFRRQMDKPKVEKKEDVFKKEKESPVLFQIPDDAPQFAVAHEYYQPDVGDFGYSGLVIVTSTKALDRKKILRNQIFDAHAQDGPAVLFLSDRSVLMGMPWDLARHSEMIARTPKTKPLASALALGETPHLVVAGGYMPAELSRIITFGFAGNVPALSAITPLLQTEAGMTLDLDKNLDATLQFNAPTEASAAHALQAVKSLRVLAELAIEKGREQGESGGWKLALENAALKALANASIERRGLTVYANLKMELNPSVVKHFTKEIVSTFRHRGDRTRSVNNLKNMILAVHSYHDQYKRLPAAAMSGPQKNDGKPLLSWRVAILPFIDDNPLYQQFDLNQPWDHPTNKKLIAQMPKIYELPGSDAKPGYTHYRTFVGPGTVLNPVNFNGQLRAPFNLGNIPDGSSNTIMIVEAAEPMIWTKPDDLVFDRKRPLPKLGITPDGFNVALADGSVRFISSKISDATLYNAIDANDGNPLGADWDR